MSSWVKKRSSKRAERLLDEGQLGLEISRQGVASRRIEHRPVFRRLIRQRDGREIQNLGLRGRTWLPALGIAEPVFSPAGKFCLATFLIGLLPRAHAVSLHGHSLE